MRFEEFGLSEPLLRAVKEAGFESPTPIQEQAIPLLLQGEDVVGQAQTGTGKTAAFGLPALEYCLSARKKEGGGAVAHAGREAAAHAQRDGGHWEKKRVAIPKVLVLSPTRELAVQIAYEFERLGKYAPAKIVCVYGGQDIDRQLRAIERGVDIVVGTPGRMLDHIKRGSLELGGVSFVVMDEADRMLDMGFIYDVAEILEKTNPERQTALFSATMPSEILKISRDYMKNPQTLRVSEDKITVEGIRQKYVLVDARSRMGYLLGVLKQENPKLALIFTRTKFAAQRLCGTLQRKGFAAESLHGDMRQGARDRAMRKFRDGSVHVLVATDLASRGIDVLEISHVINYDLPEEATTYVHRIGRTGRMGAEGVAISLIFEDQLGWIDGISHVTKMPVEEMKVEPEKIVYTDVARAPQGRSYGGRPSYGGGHSSYAGGGRYGGGGGSRFSGSPRSSYGRDGAQSGGATQRRSDGGSYGRSGAGAREGGGFGQRRSYGGSGYGREGGRGGGSYGERGGTERVVKSRDGVEYFEGRKNYGQRSSARGKRDYGRRR